MQCIYCLLHTYVYTYRPAETERRSARFMSTPSKNGSSNSNSNNNHNRSSVDSSRSIGNSTNATSSSSSSNNNSNIHSPGFSKVAARRKSFRKVKTVSIVPHLWQCLYACISYRITNSTVVLIGNIGNALCASFYSE
jgi:hypothetical protein